MQATVWCTTSRARKVVVSLTLVALIAAAINWVCWRVANAVILNDIHDVFKVVVTVSVLVINMMVVRQVRRSATNAAVNLGVQQHHHSTSSYSVVPTVMLIASSLIYVLLYGSAGVFGVLFYGDFFHHLLHFDDDTWDIMHKVTIVVFALASLIFAYNFYVYLVTGKRFRSELQKLFSCCLSSSSSPAAAAAADNNAEIARRRQTLTTTV